jgi:epoxide hydrolase-like predicted phosphatase
MVERVSTEAPVTAPEIDAVIFDFAGVLSTSPSAGMIERARQFDLDLATFLPILLGPLDVDSDHPYHELERGRITMDEFDAAIEPMWRAAGLTAFPSMPRGDELLALVEPVAEMVAVARDIRAAGLPTAILTNNTREWGAWRTAWDADNLVDVVIDSCEVGLRKPNRAVFELTVERLGGPPFERCLFLDDFSWNVAAADALGFTTMHVTDPVAAAAAVRARLGL